MLQVWKDDTLLAVKDTKEHIEEFCEDYGYNIDKVSIIKVLD